MPNGLSVLLGLQRQPGSSGQIPLRSTEESDLDELIPEEELFQAQEAIAGQGRESGGAFAVPSREALRQSGRSALSRFFAQTRAKGEAAARPQQVAGEFGLERERIAQRGGIEQAAFGAQTAAELRQLQHEQALERQRELQGSITGRTAATQRSVGERSAGTQGAIRQRQIAADQLRRAAALDKQAQSAYDLFGLGSRRRLQSEAQALRQQAQAGLAVPIEDEEGEDVIELDLTPEQLAQLQSLLGDQ